MPDNQKPYGKWTREELRTAEATAREFLHDNSSQIADTLRAKTKYLETLIQRVALPRTTFEDRLDYDQQVTFSCIRDLRRWLKFEQVYVPQRRAA